MKTMKLLVLSLLSAVALGNEVLEDLANLVITPEMLDMGLKFAAMTEDSFKDMGFTGADLDNIKTCIASVAEKGTAMDMEFLGPVMAAMAPFDIDKLTTAIGEVCEGDTLKRLLLSLFSVMNGDEALKKFAALKDKMDGITAVAKSAFKVAKETLYNKYFTEDADAALETGWTTRKATADDKVANDDLTVGEDAYFHETEQPTGQKAKVVKTTANETAFSDLAKSGKIKRAADKADGTPGDVLPADQQDDAEVSDLLANDILTEGDLQDLQDAADLDAMAGEQDADAGVLQTAEDNASPAFLAGAGVTALLSLLL